jgi:diguanylate cyclase
VADGEALAERLIGALQRPFERLGRPVGLSASVGIALYPDHGQREQLVARADAAMCAAKRAGGASYTVFDADGCGRAGAADPAR